MAGSSPSPGPIAAARLPSQNARQGRGRGAAQSGLAVRRQRQRHRFDAPGIDLGADRLGRGHRHQPGAGAQRSPRRQHRGAGLPGRAGDDHQVAEAALVRFARPQRDRRGPRRVTRRRLCGTLSSRALRHAQRRRPHLAGRCSGGQQHQRALGREERHGHVGGHVRSRRLARRRVEPARHVEREARRARRVDRGHQLLAPPGDRPREPDAEQRIDHQVGARQHRARGVERALVDAPQLHDRVAAGAQRLAARAERATAPPRRRAGRPRARTAGPTPPSRASRAGAPARDRRRRCCRRRRRSPPGALAETCARSPRRPRSPRSPSAPVRGGPVARSRPDRSRGLRRCRGDACRRAASGRARHAGAARRWLRRGRRHDGAARPPRAATRRGRPAGSRSASRGRAGRSMSRPVSSMARRRPSFRQRSRVCSSTRPVLQATPAKSAGSMRFGPQSEQVVAAIGGGPEHDVGAALQAIEGVVDAPRRRDREGRCRPRRPARGCARRRSER